MRIVSLLPAATEMVCALGLEEQLVGVSHECDYPASVQSLPKVTRTRLAQGMSSDAIDAQVREMVATESALYELDQALIGQLRPDVIVTQSLCHVCAVSDREVDQAIRDLPQRPQVVRLGPQRLRDIFDGMRQVADACGVPSAYTAVEALEMRVARVAEASRATVEAKPTVLLLEWIDPLFSAGHWNPELIELAGGLPVLSQAGQASRRLDWSEVQAADPDVMIVACCGFSIDRTVEDMPTLVSYPGFGKLRCTHLGRVYLVNGSDYFNRPGPRLVDSLELLAHTLFPERHALSDTIECAVRVSRVGT